MPAPAVDYAHALALLRQRLTELANALAEADLERVLACEGEIESALCGVITAGAGHGDRALLAAEIERARTALSHCRRLGASLNDVVRLSLTMYGFEGGYNNSAGVTGGTGLHTFRRSV
jgi:hypothetical protein